MKTGRVTWSREAMAIFGLTEFGGDFQAWAKTVHPADLEFAKATVERALRDRTSTEFRIEHRALQAGGTTVWIEGRGEVLRDEAGEPVAIIGVVQDITRR